MTSTWRCAETTETTIGWHFVYGPTIDRRKITFPVVLPADAVITSARVHADFRRDLFGSQVRQNVNNTHVDEAGFAVIELPNGANTTELTVTLEFQRNNYPSSVTKDTETHSISPTVRDIYLTIDYVSGIIPDPDASKAYTNNVRLPRLLDKNLREIKRLRPSSLSLSLTIDDISTASMTLVDGTWMDATQFVELYHIGGSVGIFRLRSDTQTYRNYATQEVNLDHAISTLMDGILPEQLKIGSASVDTVDVLAQLLTYQPETRWQIGTCELSQHLTYDFDAGTNIWTAINNVKNLSTAEMMWQYDFSTYPWTLNLVNMPNTVSCEARFNGALTSATVSTNRDDLVTRMYAYGKNGITVGTVNDGKDYIDADTIDEWGIVCGKYSDNSITDKETLLENAKKELAKKKNPPISIDVSLVELSAITGLPYDHFRLGSICRVAMPKFGRCYDERILTLNADNVLLEPQKVKVTMSTEGKSVSGIIEALGGKNGLISAGTE